MGKYIALVLGTVVVLCAGIGIGYTLKCQNDKMAIVDVVAVVNQSTQVQTLKNEVESQKRELAAWLQKAQEDVKSEKDEQKKKELLQKYNSEFAQKRAEISNEYTIKLRALDKDINNTIIRLAKEKGYHSVISKTVVIYGGTDITEDVIKVVK